jgi:hypothetical protein
VTSITTTYTDGIYKDADGDIIRVENGKAEIVGTGHDGVPYIDMSRAYWLADLPRTASTPVAPVPFPKPTLPNGIYRERDGDTIIVLDGKAVEIVATGDGCSLDNETHTDLLGEDDFLDGAVRLIAPKPEDVEPPMPADGVYADKDGDIVQVKDGRIRYLSDYVAYGSASNFFDGTEDFHTYGPYVPLVEEDATK